MSQGIYRDSRRCPACPGVLTMRRVEGRRVESCPDCHGIFLEIPVLEPHLSKLKAQPVGARNRLCPTCGSGMPTLTTESVELDVCPAHGVWFDPGELAILRARLTGRATDAPAPPGVTADTGRTAGFIHTLMFFLGG